MLVLGRDALFATTSVAAQQQADLESSAHAVRHLREDTVSRIDAMHSEVVTNQERIKRVLEDNPIDQALPSRLANESLHEYSRRANAVISRKERLSDAFSAGYAPVLSPATRMARFKDTSSISNPGGMHSAPSRRLVGVVRPIGINQGASGYITSQHSSLAMTTDVFEAFALEKEEEICNLVDLHLADVVVLPPGVRNPKLDNPPKYKGENDHAMFMAWVGKVCTWFQAGLLGGPALDSYRIVVLKTCLDTYALTWFNKEVSVNGGSVTYEFASIICALHRHFVTSANAQQATKDYEAVRYDPSLGVEHLVNELTSTAANMCKPPSEFSLRQRFMRLIPAQIHNHMVQRGLFPEFTDLQQLKNHARALIKGNSQLRGTGTSSALSPSTAPTTRPRTTPRLATRTNPPAWAPTFSTPARSDPVTCPNRAPISSSATATVKTCYSCG
ncbi:hypothetical protein C8J57DRAFT_1538305 [Mycena rebaudengoi]|nr:hypothetical protein C8J57DRAFT_1538305 [Mycena rebaudengoi]